MADLGYQSEMIPTSDQSYAMGVYQNGIVAITLGEEQYLVLEPTVVSGAVEWSCFGDGTSAAQLPLECRE